MEMKAQHGVALALALAVILGAFGAAAQHTKPKVKVLPTAEDALQETVLVGRSSTGAMIIQFELAPAESMWMTAGDVSVWMEHPVGPDELYSVRVVPIDPRSKARIPYTGVKFTAANLDNGKIVDAVLHPIWGGDGLYYARNTTLAGDGAYEATIIVSIPTFARGPKDYKLWMESTAAKFHLKLAGGKITEVSEPIEETALKK